MLEKSNNPAMAIFFFVPIIFIGAFFLLNLTLAVIKIKFTEEHQSKKQKGGQKKAKPKLKTDFESDGEDKEKDALLVKAEERIKIHKLQFEMAGYNFDKMTNADKEELMVITDIKQKLAKRFQPESPLKQPAKPL